MSKILADTLRMLAPKPRKKAKPKVPRSADPHTCVILAIDPGKASGWAIFVAGESGESGVARTRIDRRDACVLASDVAEVRKLPLVVVAEKWTPGGKFAGARTMAGLGAQWGLWLAAIEEAEIPKARIIRVHTQTWRAATLGGGWGIKSDEWDWRAKACVSRETGVLITDDNEADAICIGLWAIRAGEVGAKMPKRAAKKAGA